MLSTAKYIGIINWCLVFLAILLYLVIFIIVLKCRRELRDISMLLTCNTCLWAFLTCVTSCVMITSNLFSGFLIINIQFCYAWGLFYDIFECLIYFSYCLQAFYRLCRVVFYKKKFLLSYYLYIILVVGQWLLVLVLLVPPVFIDWYTRIPTEMFCLIPYTYIGPEVYHILILYCIPLICLVIVYIWITTDIRRSSQRPNLAVSTIQRQRNQRDLAVIKRILVLISILIILRFPTIIFMIYGVVVGSLYPFTYGIVGIITSICLIFIGIITIKTTTQLQKGFLDIFIHRNNQIQTERMRVNHIVTPMEIINSTNIPERSKKNNIIMKRNIP